MKQLILIFLFFIICKTYTNAQCTPLQYSGNHNSITPDSVHFEHAKQYQNFNTTFYLQVAHDTVTSFGTFVYDSIKVDSISIKPRPIGTSISYTCNPPSCSFLGSNTGCMNLSISSAMTQQPGTFQLLVYTSAKGTLGAVKNVRVPLVIDWYNIVVDSSVTSSIGSTINESCTVYPNPVTQRSFKINSVSSTQYQIINSLGVTVLQGDLMEGKNQIQLPQNISNGLYFLQIGNSTQKIIINQ